MLRKSTRGNYGKRVSRTTQKTAHRVRTAHRTACTACRTSPICLRNTPGCTHGHSTRSVLWRPEGGWQHVAAQWGVPCAFGVGCSFVVKRNGRGRTLQFTEFGAQRTHGSDTEHDEAPNTSKPPVAPGSSKSCALQNSHQPFHTQGHALMVQCLDVDWSSPTAAGCPLFRPASPVSFYKSTMPHFDLPFGTSGRCTGNRQ